MNEYERKALENITKRIHEKGVSNEFLVSLMILAAEYLNLTSAYDYAKKIRKTYRGVLVGKFEKVTFLNKHYIIDNE